MWVCGQRGSRRRAAGGGAVRHRWTARRRAPPQPLLTERNAALQGLSGCSGGKQIGRRGGGGARRHFDDRPTSPACSPAGPMPNRRDAAVRMPGARARAARRSLTPNSPAAAAARAPSSRMATALMVIGCGTGQSECMQCDAGRERPVQMYGWAAASWPRAPRPACAVCQQPEEMPRARPPAAPSSCEVG